jgi:beta-glucanase (GH16 family)
MANFFSFLFGSKYPSTAKYEAQQEQLYADRKHFIEYEQSPVYKKYLQLDEIVNSGDFEKRVNKLKNEKFEQTEQYTKFSKHRALSKSKDIKTFLAFVESGKQKRLESLLISPVYLEMKELELTVNSASFKQKMTQKGFKQTDEYQELQSLKKLYKQPDIKFVRKTLESGEYRTYETTKNSTRLQEFIELDAFLKSDEYIAFYKFIHDKDRFKKSEEANLLHEYNEIKASNDFKRFVKTKNNYPFTEIDKWELVFEDDFDTQKLNANNWMTGYYWGKALLNDNYVLNGEKQFFTDKNIELRDSNLRIFTKQEACKGKIWDAERGFIPANFDYTSGLVSTGHSFRQTYGKTEIKFKLKGGQNVNHAIWMLGEKMIPQITILKSGLKSAKSFQGGTISGTINAPIVKSQTLTGPSLTDDYSILTLEWKPNHITWFINGVKIGEQTGNVPSEPMYLMFSTHITTTIKDSELPAQIEIDWVKCYKPVN